jgi:diguanylate cyclase (GGDEF)-like protein
LTSSASPNPNELYAISAELRLLQAEFAAYRAQSDQLIGASTEGFWSWDSDTNRLIDHRHCAVLLGASEIGFTAENVNVFNAAIEHFCASNVLVFTQQILLHCGDTYGDNNADTTQRWFQIYGVRRNDESSGNTRITGTLRDIHDVKMAEKTQAAVFQISEAAHTCTELEDMYRRIHYSIAELLPAKNLFIALYDRATEILSFPYYIDEIDAPPEPEKVGDSGLTQQVIRTGLSVLMTPEMRDIRIKNGEKIIGAVCLDWLGVPLINAGEIIGALVIQSYSGDVRYTEKDQALLRFVSNQVAAAIVRKRALDRITHMALHDALTGLPNRALWHDRLSQTIQEAGREQAQFALLYLDLNLFKPVNDQHGHAVGDALLKQVAQRLQGCVRLSDTLARLGGDEFTVLLRNIKSRSDVLLVVKQIEEAIAVPYEIQALTIQISIAVGMAIYPADGATADALMRGADEALYVQKNARSAS